MLGILVSHTVVDLVPGSVLLLSRIGAAGRNSATLLVIFHVLNETQTSRLVAAQIQ